MGARYRWFDIGWVLLTNLTVLAGVVAWGWPPGNVFLLFWVENVILGAVTAVKVQTAEGADPTADNRYPRWVSTGFFTVHYGIFALVHGAFVTIIALSAGVSWAFVALGLPIVLIAIRHVADLVTVWFLGRQRFAVSPGQAFASPYSRLIVLHMATLLGFMLVIPFGGARRWATVLNPVRDWFAAQGYPLSDGALVVVLLMVLKSIADVGIIGGGRIKPANLRFSFSSNW